MNERPRNVQILPLGSSTPGEPDALNIDFTLTDAIESGKISLVECEVRSRAPQALGHDILDVMNECGYSADEAAILEVFKSPNDAASIFAILRGATHPKNKRHGLIKTPVNKVLRQLFHLEANKIYPEVNLAFGKAAREIGQRTVRQWVRGDSTKELEIITAFRPWLTRVYSGKIEATK